MREHIEEWCKQFEENWKLSSIHTGRKEIKVFVEEGTIKDSNSLNVYLLGIWVTYKGKTKPCFVSRIVYNKVGLDAAKNWAEKEIIDMIFAYAMTNALHNNPSTKELFNDDTL